ncbi:YadA-like family protein [Enterobacter sp. KB-221C9]|uniref:YadA C-terminal domain-containing protein n=1 Tax=Enterobacter sp. KB-221C9 TaxID=3242496 RepID=UPI0035209DDF
MKSINKSLVAVAVFGALFVGVIGNTHAVTPASDVQFANGWDLETVNQQQNAVTQDHESRISENHSDIIKLNQENLLRDDAIQTAGDKADQALQQTAKNGNDIINLQNQASTFVTAPELDQVKQDQKVVDANQNLDIINHESRIHALETAPTPKDGINGKDGVDGKDGATGATGAQGLQGVAGVAGANGADGKDGANGRDGVDGKDGINGKDGSNGVTTTVNKVQVDTATQDKVAANSQAITATATQSASVAQDLQDAKKVFSQQQANTNAQFKSLRDEVDGNKKEARSGAASAVAIASMPQVEAGQKVMFSAGVGSFKDEQAISVGASFHAGAATVKAGVSSSTNNDFAMGAGVGIGF